MNKFRLLMKMIIIFNENDYQYQYVACNATKKCVGAKTIYVYAWLHRTYMATEDKNSILLSDVSIEGDVVEKDKLILDAKISGDIKANVIETHSNSLINGNITSKESVLGGKIKGNISSDKIKIKKTGDIEGVLNQKTLAIEEGASLKIKTETYK